MARSHRRGSSGRDLGATVVWLTVSDRSDEVLRVIELVDHHEPPSVVCWLRHRTTATALPPESSGVPTREGPPISPALGADAQPDRRWFLRAVEWLAVEALELDRQPPILIEGEPRAV